MQTKTKENTKKMKKMNKQLEFYQTSHFVERERTLFTRGF